MTLKIVFIILAAAISFWVAYPIYSLVTAAVLGIIFGVLILGIILGLESQINRLNPKSALGAGVGVGIASLAFFALSEFLKILVIPPQIAHYVLVSASLLFFYFGIAIGIKKGHEAEQTERKFSSKSKYGEAKILDTSVIIDGRIADVAEAGFIEGVMILPKFIIKELQYIADSPDHIKRVRGRRGLDVLKRMQEIPNIVVKITSHDFPNVREADLKLVELAKKLKGTIITNDFNLNKVAGLHGVKVLNLNQLSNALKPVVLPGEKMSIRVVKEGKEENQGIGYLEDGTMVVVDDAKRHLGREIEVSVTSVLQTPTGRMIFSRVRDEEGIVSDLRG
ncbi:MAG TPA: PIN domain-containing protein [Thermodesulfobacteriota bacterium]|nr:PIN domain-containing protein [Thermodesulfobacteriota bacterium]